MLKMVRKIRDAREIVKKAGYLWLVVAIMLVAMPHRAYAQETCAVKPGDEDTVVDTVRSMYAAASVNDRAKVRSYLAQGFYTFANGIRSDGDYVMAAFESSNSLGGKFVYTVTRPDVHIHCNEAWIAYVNDGSITWPGASDATPMKWLESAVLVRQDGVWKMEFLHRTFVPMPAIPIPSPVK
jgi:hypothetical protein